jgi:hypothetical protein
MIARLISRHRQKLALRRLEADRAMRLRMIGAPYAKRRAAALKGVGR